MCICSVIITQSTPELNHSQTQRNGVTICIKLVEHNQTRASRTDPTHMAVARPIITDSLKHFLIYTYLQFTFLSIVEVLHTVNLPLRIISLAKYISLNRRNEEGNVRAPNYVASPKWQPFLVSKGNHVGHCISWKMAALLPQIPEQFQPQTLFSFPQRIFGKKAEESSFRAEGSSYYRTWLFGFCIIL